MANSYSQILIQIIFSVKGRESLILEKHRESVEKYICGIISLQNSKPLAIYCNPDHCHVLIGLNPKTSISQITKSIKANSSKWINNQNWMRGRFSWQEGYGAFSYSKSQLDAVVKYVRNQPIHHKKQTFREEYLALLHSFNVEHDEKYLFTFLE